MQSGTSGGNKWWKVWLKLIPSYQKQIKRLKYLENYSRQPEPDCHKTIVRKSIRFFGGL